MSDPPKPPIENPVSLILGALAFGAFLGMTLQSLVTWGVRTLQTGQPGGPVPSLSSPPALLLLIGTFGGIIAAGVATGTVLAPIRNPWRQAMLALVAGLGSFVLSLVTLPVDRAFGRSGLLALAAIAALLCLVIGRRLSRRMQRA